jgi:putative membrane protein
MHSIDAKYNVKDYAQLLLQGCCIGVANAIPGVSGGTVAFLFGIYEDLINSIKSFNGLFIRDLCHGRFIQAWQRVAWRFTGTVILGAFISIVCFSKLIGWLIDTHPIHVHAFFFGLILASIPIIAKIIHRWRLPLLVLVGGAAVVTHIVVSSVPVNTPDSYWFIFLCGILAVTSMILPGLSGAFILVLLGKYAYIIDAVNQRDLLVLGLFSLGMVFGILSFVRILSWFFQRYHDATIAVLTGLVIGSLSKIWPWKKTLETAQTVPDKVAAVHEMNVLPDTLDAQVLLAIMFMVIGIGLTFLLNRSPQKKIFQD